MLNPENISIEIKKSKLIEVILEVEEKHQKTKKQILQL
jgi:hypothetical protein